MLSTDQFRNVGAMAVGLFALIAVAACMPKSEPGETGMVATVMPQSVATHDSDAPTPLANNVAVLGNGSASGRDEDGRLIVDKEFAHLAIDGDPDSIWNSQQYAPQWFSVAFDDLYLVDRIQLVVTQAPASPTTHEVWLGNGSGVRTLYKRFSNVHTEDGQILDVPIDPPRHIDEVLVLTVHSPSWIAWREVKVFGASSGDPGSEEATPLVKLIPVATGLEMPVQITHAGDGSGRLFVVEQEGRIRVIRNGHAPGRLGARPTRQSETEEAGSEAEAESGSDARFLDISDRVKCCGEGGLLNVAFPPSYAARQHFYVSYVNVDSNVVISRFRTTTDPDRADPDSEEVVLTIDRPLGGHFGGPLVFGPQDGYLYIGSGDGGHPTGHAEISQDPSILLGKILRIDVESGDKPYGIPPDNPFRHIDGYRDEIWALGLRNPWGLAFDRLTKDLYILDVGQAEHEEVNFQPASSGGGENYGWFIMEANRCFRFSSIPCSAEGMTTPIAEYDHSLGCAIVGGVIYRGAITRLQGLLIFADFCSGRIWGLRRSDVDAQQTWQSVLLINSSVPVSGIGEDEDGNAYVLGYGDGVIYMIR